MLTIAEIYDTFKTEESTIEFLINNDIIQKEKTCWQCKKPMNINKTQKIYRCSNYKCRKSMSIFKNTFFSTCKYGIDKCMIFCYLYFLKLPSEGLKTTLKLSSKTVCDWAGFLRQLVGNSVNEIELQIGGDGVVVEIDETKLGKRKYHRGHYVEGVWVIVGIERTVEKKMFAIEVVSRDQATIEDVLRKYLCEGSIVHTDCWKAYFPACRNLGFQHKVVNHKKEFKNSVDGTHTNTVEGQNNALKILIKPRNRNRKNIKYYLLYFLWRRLHKKDIWGGFIKALKEVKYE